MRNDPNKGCEGDYRFVGCPKHGGVNVLGPVSRKSRKLFGPEKPFVKLRPAYSVKLVFSYVVRGIKIKITAKFRASRRLRFEDTKRIMAPEIRPKSFGTFEKQAPGLNNPTTCMKWFLFACVFHDSYNPEKSLN